MLSESVLRIGFVINPVAGMGGRVGLKGTDGLVEEALRRGAKPAAGERAVTALRLLEKRQDRCLFTCGGNMGEEALRESGISEYQVVYHPCNPSTGEDTLLACREFVHRNVALILFCGGDGTARDVYAIAGDRIPVLGIPAGVKMYSAVFGVNPAACAEIVNRLEETVCRDSEVVDVDEEAYRRGELATRIYGFARVPSLPLKVQTGKQVFEEPEEEGAKRSIGLFIREIIRKDTVYILGAGTTTAEIARQFGVEKTLLGVDAVKDGKILARDADEKTLLSLIDREPLVKIIISPLGAQGFVLGRGTQSISPVVVRKIGVRNVIVVATPHKLAQTRVLYIDSGDAELDREFGDSLLVISGYRMGQRKKLFHPGEGQ